jgi:hypothetical protein
MQDSHKKRFKPSLGGIKAGSFQEKENLVNCYDYDKKTGRQKRTIRTREDHCQCC